MRATMKRTVLLATVGVAAFCHGQSSGTATTKGACSPAVSGNKNTFTIKCGIDEEQGKQILAILNKLLADQLDTKTVMAKLDELAEQKRQVISAPNGIAIGGGTVNNPTVNNYGPPLPHVTWSILKDKLTVQAGSNPQTWVHISIDRDFSGPRFAVICDRPCKASGLQIHVGTAATFRATGARFRIIRTWRHM